MPIYEYKCTNCGYEMEELQSMKEEPLVKCPNCGKDSLRRLIGSGSGIIFKGSGFYLTDYKNKPEEKSSKTAEKTKPSGKKSAEPKPTKSESKKS